MTILANRRLLQEAHTGLTQERRRVARHADLTGKAREALRVGALREAHTILEGALVLNPEDAEAWRLAIEWARRTQHDDVAETALRALLELEPTAHAEALSLARLQARRGQRAEALGLCEWVLLHADADDVLNEAETLRGELGAKI